MSCIVVGALPIEHIAVELAGITALLLVYILYTGIYSAKEVNPC